METQATYKINTKTQEEIKTSNREKLEYIIRRKNYQAKSSDKRVDKLL